MSKIEKKMELTNVNEFDRNGGDKYLKALALRENIGIGLEIATAIVAYLAVGYLVYSGYKMIDAFLGRF